jgi:hypothetical protein
VFQRVNVRTAENIIPRAEQFISALFRFTDTRGPSAERKKTYFRLPRTDVLGFYETAGYVKQNFSRTAGLFLGQIAERHSEQIWGMARIFLQFISGFYTHSTGSRFATRCTLGSARMKSVLLSQ